MSSGSGANDKPVEPTTTPGGNNAQQVVEQFPVPQIIYVPLPSPSWERMVPMIQPLHSPMFDFVVPPSTGLFLPSFPPNAQVHLQYPIAPNTSVVDPAELVAAPNLPFTRCYPTPQKTKVDKLGFVEWYVNQKRTHTFDLIGTRAIKNEASRSPKAKLTKGDRNQIRKDLFQLNRNHLVVFSCVPNPAKGVGAGNKPRIVCYMKCENQPNCKKCYVVKRCNSHFGYYESRCSHDHDETSDRKLPPEVRKMVERRYNKADAS